MKHRSQFFKNRMVRVIVFWSGVNGSPRCHKKHYPHFSKNGMVRVIIFWSGVSDSPVATRNTAPIFPRMVWSE